MNPLERTYTVKEWEEEGKKLFGPDKDEWRFKCFNCGRIQSVEIIRDQMQKEIPSKSHGLLKKGDVIAPHQECFSPRCNWVSFGLFKTNIKVTTKKGKICVFDFDRGKTK